MHSSSQLKLHERGALQGETKLMQASIKYYRVNTGNKIMNTEVVSDSDAGLQIQL